MRRRSHCGKPEQTGVKSGILQQISLYSRSYSHTLTSQTEYDRYIKMDSRFIIARRVLASAAIVGGTIITSACGTDAKPPAPGGRNQPRVEPVQVIVAANGSASRNVAVTGMVEPVRTVGVVSQLSGVLQQVIPQEGDFVREGAVLARIAAPEVDAGLRSAEVALQVAQGTARRSAQLFDSGIITAPEKERDEAALAAALASRDQLRVRQGFATVTAPISGVILARRAEVGDLASAQGRLFTIGDLSTLVVRVPVSELNVTALRSGGPAEVILDALPGRTFEGTIRRIFPAADSTSRLVPVEIALTGVAARQAKPGFLARVTFHLDAREGVLLIPSTAVLENPRGAVVYVVQNGKAALRAVERGSTYQGRVEIVKGLAIGDSVVVAGNTLLRDGSTVRVMKSDPVPKLADTAGTSVGAP